MFCEGKVLVTATKAWGSEGITPSFLNLVARHKWVIIVTLGPVYLWGQIPL